MQTQSQQELVLEVTKRTNKWQLTYAVGAIYSKFGCSVTLQTTEEEDVEKKIMLANVYKWPQVGAGERKKKWATCSINMIFLPKHQGADNFWYCPF